MSSTTEKILHWPNGQKKRVCTLKNGVRDGWDRMWNEEGVLVDEGCYKQGKAVGVHRRWSPKGVLIEEIVFHEDGKFDFRGWDARGNLRIEKHSS